MRFGPDVILIIVVEHIPRLQRLRHRRIHFIRPARHGIFNGPNIFNGLIQGKAGVGGPSVEKGPGRLLLDKTDRIACFRLQIAPRFPGLGVAHPINEIDQGMKLVFKATEALQIADSGLIIFFGAFNMVFALQQDMIFHHVIHQRDKVAAKWIVFGIAGRTGDIMIMV